ELAPARLALGSGRLCESNCDAVAIARFAKRVEETPRGAQVEISRKKRRVRDGRFYPVALGIRQPELCNQPIDIFDDATAERRQAHGALRAGAEARLEGL